MSPQLLKCNKEQHLNRAAHNRRFVESARTLPGDYRGWQVTAVFYAAVHLLQAYLAAKTRFYPQTHQERDQLVISLPALRPIHDHYSELKRVSVSSRYGCLPVSDQDLQDALAEFDAIERHLRPLLVDRRSKKPASRR